MIRCAGWHHVSDHHGLHDDLPDHLWRPGHRNMAAALVKVGTIAVDATVRAAPLVPLLAALRFSCGLGELGKGNFPLPITASGISGSAATSKNVSGYPR